MMLAKSEQISILMRSIFHFSKKSRRTTTPKPFNNPRLTPLGIVSKQPRVYDYDLPEDLPNRHLYWNRSVENKLARQRMAETRLYKLKVNPIHDAEGNRLFTRPIPEIAAELTSRTLIKESVGRTIENIHEVIVRFPSEFIGSKGDEGVQWPALKFALNELHDRHMPTMNTYKFCSFCQLMNMARQEPTESMVLHFFRHLEAMKENKTNKISISRLAIMSRYFFFKRQYEKLDDLFYRKEQKLELFKETDPEPKTFEDVIPELYTQEQLEDGLSSIAGEKRQSYLKWINSMPGGKKLVSLASVSAKTN